VAAIPLVVLDIKPVELHYPGTQVLENLIFALSRIGDPLYIFPDGKTPIIALYGTSPALRNFLGHLPSGIPDSVRCSDG
jgi:hypothetical protein